MNYTRLIVWVTAAALIGGTAGAMAGEHHEKRHNQERKEWNREHPRRAEVNKRLENQGGRINKEVKEGDISGKEAAKLHKEDRQIRAEERAMASQNGGHITKEEQKVLNQQENAVSKQIGK